MKRRLITASILAISSVLAITIPQLAARSTARQEAASSDFSHTDGYVLREYEGAIGVFKEGAGEPITVIDVDPRTLPEKDRAALIRGIYAADDDELSRRIEDFSS